MDTHEVRLYTAVLISCLVIGALFIYYAVIVYRSNRKYFKTLRDYYLQEVALLEAERTRIARDLHDELGPNLSLANIFIRTALEHDPANRGLTEAEGLVLQVTNRLGEIARNLTPKVLLQKGLQVALEGFLAACKQAVSADISFGYHLYTPLPTDFSLQLYRIIQELMNNAIKHANAKQISLSLVEKKGMLYLYYRDDGIGLPVHTAEEGIGIQSLRQRAIMLGGRMRIENSKDPGVAYLFQLPIPQ